MSIDDNERVIRREKQSIDPSNGWIVSIAFAETGNRIFQSTILNFISFEATL